MNNTFSDSGGNEKGLNILCGYHIENGREIYSEINRPWVFKLD